jgi:hypothetical protein
VTNVYLRAAICGALAVSMCSMGQAVPTNAKNLRTFSVPSEDAITAIGEFGIQADVQIIADPNAVQGKRFAAVSGRFSVDDGLRRLLAGTGLTYTFGAPATMSVRTRSNGVIAKTVNAKTEVALAPPIVNFHCAYHTNMSEWNDDGEPYVSEYKGAIFVHLDDDFDEPVLAGQARLFIINADATEYEEDAPSLFNLLDMRSETAAYLPLLHSTEAGNFSPDVCNLLSEEMVLSRNMLIFDRLEILPEFRRQQLGLRYMQTAVKRFGLGCRIVAIKPFPLQFERKSISGDSDLEWYARMSLKDLPSGIREATNTLQKYYGREGFVPVRGTDLMILDLYQRMSP